MFNTAPVKGSKQVLNLLANRWAIGCLGALTIQQLIEASSAVWLVKVMASIASGANFVPFLILYVASIALYYVPNGVAFVMKTTWKQQAQRSFVDAFVSSNRNNIVEWSNKGLKEQKLSILTAEGPQTILLFIDYIWDLYSYVLSVFFYIMALSIAVEPMFAVAYSVSVVCVFIIMKLNRRAQRQLTQKALAARVELCQSLLDAWDNVLLGNTYNFALWKDKTSQRLDRCLQRNVALERFDQFLAIFVSMITAFPTLLVVGYFMIINQDDPVKLSAFVVILPLLFNILSYTYQTLSLIFRWRMHRSKLNTVYRAIQPARDNLANLIRKVKWPKMSFTPAIVYGNTIAPENQISLPGPRVLSSPQDIMGLTTNTGRYTIRGENGCGKSTALLMVKNALASKAFFLPTHSQLSFLAETNKYSTGESLHNRLVEIIEKVDADVLLLDEWDANLDHENKERLSVLIDELAQSKCVIEVRHR